MAKITHPYSLFVDTDGSPLEDGYVYIGTYGFNPENSPIPIYWDAALTIQAPQPLRTVNGQIHRSGTAANVYVDGSYSIVIRDKNRALVSSQLDISDSSDDFATSLAAVGGSGLIGFSHSQAYAAGTIGAKGKRSVNPMDHPWNAVGNGVTPDDSALAACFAYCKANSFDIDLGNRQYALAAPLVLNGYDSFTINSRGATFMGPTTGSITCLLDVKNCTDFRILGRLGFAGRYNTGLGCGIWIHADTGANCSLIDINSLAFSGCTLAYKFGDVAYPDKTVSEINVFGGYMYGCPEGVRIESTQAVVNFIGATINTGAEGGDAAWQARTQTSVRTLGGYFRMTGGALNHASSSSGTSFDVQPITSATYSNPYGSIVCTNVMIESASKLATATNPGAIATPSIGRLQFIGCGGYHQGNSFPFVHTAADFPGVVDFSSNHFYANVSRSQPNIECLSTATQVYCDEQSFSTNFLSQLAGVTGGSLHFRNKLILSVSTPSSQAVSSGVLTTINYASVTNGGDFDRFVSGYSSGVFTVPAGGLKDVSVRVGFSPGSAVSTDVFVVVNGSIGDTGVTLSTAGGMDAFIKTLNAGDTVRIRCQPAGAGITLSGSFNHFKIMASN